MEESLYEVWNSVNPGAKHPSTYFPFNASLMANLIKVIRGYTRLELRCDNVQNFTAQFADLAHSLYSLRIQYINLFPVQGVLTLRYACLGPVGTWYGLGHGAPRGEGIDWSHGASELVLRKRIEESNLRIAAWADIMYCLVSNLGARVVSTLRDEVRASLPSTDPIPLEAFLTTEEAVFAEF